MSAPTSAEMAIAREVTKGLSTEGIRAAIRSGRERMAQESRYVQRLERLLAERELR